MSVRYLHLSNILKDENNFEKKSIIDAIKNKFNTITNNKYTIKVKVNNTYAHNFIIGPKFINGKDITNDAQMQYQNDYIISGSTNDNVNNIKHVFLIKSSQEEQKDIKHVFLIKSSQEKQKGIKHVFLIKASQEQKGVKHVFLIKQ